MHGCCNGVVHADIEYPTPCVMFLRHEWKTFAHTHNFLAGHVLCFKLVEADMLSIKIYGHSRAHLGCCEEGLSDAESSSSSNNDEEDITYEDADNEPPPVKSEYDGSGSS
ncbi:L-ascorbate oxidase-like protein [Hordeum vulgare]|nr:L-ascorbate oxidase-like protein [Hordeum vulgare]